MPKLSALFIVKVWGGCLCEDALILGRGARLGDYCGDSSLFEGDTNLPHNSNQRRGSSIPNLVTFSSFRLSFAFVEPSKVLRDP